VLPLSPSPIHALPHILRYGTPAYRQNGGALERVRQIAAHEPPRTNKLYARTQDETSLGELERIREFECVHNVAALG
jgi:hypothetical protein